MEILTVEKKCILMKTFSSDMQMKQNKKIEEKKRKKKKEMKKKERRTRKKKRKMGGNVVKLRKLENIGSLVDF